MARSCTGRANSAIPNFVVGPPQRNRSTNSYSIGRVGTTYSSAFRIVHTTFSRIIYGITSKCEVRACEIWARGLASPRKIITRMPYMDVQMPLPDSEDRQKRRSRPFRLLQTTTVLSVASDRARSDGNVLAPNKSSILPSSVQVDNPLRVRHCACLNRCVST